MLVVSTVFRVTNPQDPWQQGQPGQFSPHAQQGGYHPPDPNSGGFPQQGGVQPGYPQQPGFSQQPGYPAVNPYAAPPVSGREVAAPSAPATITTAFWIAMVVPVLVTVLYAVYMLLTLRFVNDAIDSAVPSGVGAGEASDFAASMMAVMVVVFVVVTIAYAVLTALWIVFGFKMRAGRNWARVTLTVFAVLWGLGAVVALVSGGATFGTTDTVPELDTPTSLVVLGYVQNGLSLFAMITFVVLVFLKPSNWFFEAAARR